MDFKDMSTALTSEKGKPMHIKYGDHLLYLDDRDKKALALSVEPEIDGKALKPCNLMIIPKHSKAFRKRRAEVHEMNVEIMAKGKHPSLAEKEKIDLETVAVGVVGWENIPWDGKLLEFNQDNLLMFLEATPPAYNQANEAIAKDEAFFDLGRKG